MLDTGLLQRAGDGLSVSLNDQIEGLTRLESIGNGQILRPNTQKNRRSF